MVARARRIEVARTPVLDDLLGYHLRRASLLDLACFAQALGDEIKPVGFTVLCLIRETPGITAAEIGRQARLQRANLAPMLAEFDTKGWIERRPDAEDQRIQHLHLSPAGEDAVSGWRARVEAQEELTFAALTPKEREVLRQLLSRIWKDG
ncbi:MarR family winged helix-turn-helix transcriptional regulator [Aureimonas sp. SK2]|uniref:MarR family winged helix-turn-helix transcriptional regulator n=1 Tax=Aureimonas sp. SK2 TaxID=3015992 RepID=UPI0024449B8A|nr:MarR family transcriptional regulator [Aureimonas sp. SK2]